MSRWYMGCYLERTAPTCQFRWYSWCDGGKFADTLADLKALVKASKKK